MRPVTYQLLPSDFAGTYAMTKQSFHKITANFVERHLRCVNSVFLYLINHVTCYLPINNGQSPQKRIFFGLYLINHISYKPSDFAGTYVMSNPSFYKITPTW